ncbi:MAG: LysE family translocator, partial [Desulfomonilaceae bacterium]
NPLTMLAFAAAFATLGMEQTPVTRLVPFFLVPGVFTGSALWWLLLSVTMGWCRKKITPRRLRLINEVSGGAIALFGLAVFLTAAMIILS